MRTTKLFAVAALALTMATSACGKKDEEEKTDEEKAQDALKGTWTSACEDSNSGGDAESSKDSFTYDGANVVVLNQNFAGSGCAAASETIRFRLTATYAIGDDIAGVDGAKQMTYTVGTVYLTGSTDDMIKNFNDGSFCGKTDWVKGTEKDVTGLTCTFGEGSDTLPTKAGGMIYEIYKMADDGLTLTMGDSEEGAKDGETAEKRPTKLDATKVFTKG